MNYSRRALPLIILCSLLLFIVLGMCSPSARNSPSPMLGKQVNFFDMPVVIGSAARFTPESWEGKIILLNFFASWCTPCAAEHELLMKIANSRKVEIYGIAWRDTQENTMNWLRKRGNPYQMVGLDMGGKSAITMGIIGVPETYVIDSNGVVRYSLREPLTQEKIDKEIMPLIDQIKSEYAPR